MSELEIIEEQTQPQALGKEFEIAFELQYQEAVGGMRSIIIFGLMAMWAKEKLPRGQYDKWLSSRKNIKRRRAYDFVKLTDLVLDNLECAQLRTFEKPYEILMLEDRKVPRQLRAERKKIFNFIEDKNAYQLELEFGMRKRRKPGNPTGKNGSGDEGDEKGSEGPPTPKQMREQFLTDFDTLYEDIRDLLHNDKDPRIQFLTRIDLKKMSAVLGSGAEHLEEIAKQMKK